MQLYAIRLQLGGGLSLEQELSLQKIFRHIKFGLGIRLATSRIGRIKSHMGNIAIFIPSIKSGGAEKQAVLLAEVLAGEHNVHFISFYGTSNASHSNMEMLENSTVSIYMLHGSFWTKIKELRRILINNSIDTVFNYLTYCDVIGCIVEKISGVRNIYNGIRNSRLPIPKYIVEKYCSNFLASKTIFNSYSGYEYFVNHGFRRDKGLVIPNCFYKIATPIRRVDREVKTIVVIGRFVEQKDYLSAIRTVAKLRDVRSDFEFCIVGYGKLETQIRQWIKNYGIIDITRILINPGNIPELLKNADIYLSTSLFEGTSNSIMEAMNWSLPIVATDVGDNYCLVSNHENGTLHKIGDIGAMVASLSALLDDVDLRIEYGMESNKRLEKYYSRQIFMANYLKLLT